MQEYRLSEHQLRGWMAAYDVGLQGNGLRKSSVYYYMLII